MCAPSFVRRIVLLYLLLAPSVAQAQDDSVRTVLISASGGIAKGAYQGGVDWAISEFMRRQQDPAFRNSVYAGRGRRYQLGSATGASAGNLNALVAAIGWCTDSVKIGFELRRNIPPEESLFWRLWVNTGFTDLLPAHRRADAEAAVLDRRFFEVVQKRIVLDALESAVPVALCEVPVGATMTKQVPERVPLTPTGGDASVQRVAAVYRVGTAEQGRVRQLDFLAPPARVRDAASLGALALLPELESTAWGAREKRFNDVFSVVLASGSFPVAFAPKQVCYVPAGLLKGQTIGDKSCVPGMFNDGGLFDNNPFALAVRLYETSRPDAPRGIVDVALSTPHRYRGRLRVARSGEQEELEQSGIGAIVQMLQGAWPSAQEYELHSLARLLARDDEEYGTKPRPVVQPRLRLSSRSSAIIGEQMGSFAGFLGRSFREYDFYTGVYDGLEFVARHFVCGDSVGSAALSCTQAAHMRLVDENIFGLGHLALKVAKWHRVEEYGGGPTGPVVVPTAKESVDALRETLLASIHNGALALTVHDPKAACGPRNDPIAAIICGTGFDTFLGALSKNTPFREAADSLLGLCRSAQLKLGECSVDKEFVRLVKSPKRYLHSLAERALENLEHAEDRIKETRKDLPEHSAMVEAAFSQYRSSTFRYRSGILGKRLEINPSSARLDFSSLSRGAGTVLLGTMMPHSVSFLGTGRVLDCRLTCERRAKATAIAAGWRPLVVMPTEHFYLAMKVEFSLFEDLSQLDTLRHGLPSKQRDWAKGAAVGTSVWTLPGMSSMEIGVLWSKHLVNEELQQVGDALPQVHFTGRLLGERLQLDVRVGRHQNWSAGVGIADVNGILYWLVR